MPIYEYECRKCSSSFELLMRSDTKIACPSCQSERVVRKLSLFAAHTARHAEAVPSCATGECGCEQGRCGSGLCGMQ